MVFGLFSLQSRRTKPSDAPLTIDGPQGPMVVDVRRHARARRMILRISKSNQHAIVTVPKGLRRAAIQEFVASRADWIAERLQDAAPIVEARDGAIIPVRGVDHILQHRPDTRGAARLSGQSPATIIIPGPEESLDRKAKDWLKREARRDFDQAVAIHAGALDVVPGRITVRDTRSRWGSCAESGALSFSWRLIMAPPHVLSYVAAHEVAHLVEMNHGPAFWALVEQLDPDMDRAKTWLKTNGSDLHRILPRPD